ncbi:hypothetical protein [Roseofilum sp. Belize Diploria]|uniref:hypothetical protein n=1 Tax=Roseofilum sp. Belize Diploria TaxID=2821501 RepID=UPI001B1E7F30|nr:hypothetical protein [Roseofilum sp. Belize Diploria]MBP0008080.1 hypothetical protein [Roseofilum sp. Belize Diploria]
MLSSEKYLNWDEDEFSLPSVAQLLQELIRAINRSDGAAWLFVQYSNLKQALFVKDFLSASGLRYEIVSLQQGDDIASQKIHQAYLQNPQIVLVEGIHNLLPNYSPLDSEVPPVMEHFNTVRETLHRVAPLPIVFLIDDLTVSYFINRAPDFFDWRRGWFNLT